MEEKRLIHGYVAIHENNQSDLYDFKRAAVDFSVLESQENSWEVSARFIPINAFSTEGLDLIRVRLIPINAPSAETARWKRRVTRASPDFGVSHSSTLTGRRTLYSVRKATAGSVRIARRPGK